MKTGLLYTKALEKPAVLARKLRA